MNTRVISGTLEKQKSVIVFCLNNASQVNKLRKLKHDKITIIHDEGDMVHQSDCQEDAGKTQEAWQQFSMNSKRIWVSATPENCSYIRKIPVKNVMKLPVNPDYNSPQYYTEWSNDYSVIRQTVEGLDPSEREITLVCTDHKVKDHDEIADNIERLLPDAVVMVYNGTDSYFSQRRARNIRMWYF